MQNFQRYRAQSNGPKIDSLLPNQCLTDPKIKCYCPKWKSVYAIEFKKWR